MGNSVPSADTSGARQGGEGWNLLFQAAGAALLAPVGRLWGRKWR